MEKRENAMIFYQIVRFLKKSKKDVIRMSRDQLRGHNKCEVDVFYKVNAMLK